MLFPLSRGNVIQWKINDKVIYIHDHSYNSGADSLIKMLATAEQNCLFIFTPLRECSETHEIYTFLGDFIKTNSLTGWVFDPQNELSNYKFNTFQNKKLLLEKIIQWIENQKQDGHIFIKGANSLKMITIVEDLIQWLGNTFQNS